ncbi:hypothetical protein [Streptomyces sp. SBT349]|uniref:hypothetical protein n=1 Tax=Streptomyces sp. SBT349 TaxID=1580539 RepID=UPI00066E4422|nr:hypothetical protein [Streptomyces sp. SBT349]
MLAHATVLEGRETEVPPGRSQWERAYAAWRLALDDDAGWRLLDGRIRELGDPRLRAVSAAAVREALPRVLLTIHAAEAVRAARVRGGDAAARQHVAVMKGFVRDSTVKAVLAEATAPVASAVRLRIDTAAGPGEAPGVLIRAAGALVDDSEADLRVLRVVLGAKDPVAAGAADAVASAVHVRAVACVNKKAQDESAVGDPDLTAALDRLRAAQRLAASGHVRVPIERDLGVLLANVLMLSCTEAVRNAEAAPRAGVRHADRLLSDAEPRLDELRELRLNAEDYAKVRDTVAAAACQALAGYFNATGDVAPAIAGYRRALTVAVSAEGRSVIQQNIDTLAAAVPSHLPSEWWDGAASATGSCRRCGRREFMPEDGYPYCDICVATGARGGGGGREVSPVAATAGCLVVLAGIVALLVVLLTG